MENEENNLMDQDPFKQFFSWLPINKENLDFNAFSRGRVSAKPGTEEFKNQFTSYMTEQMKKRLGLVVFNPRMLINVIKNLSENDLPFLLKYLPSQPNLEELKTEEFQKELESLIFNFATLADQIQGKIGIGLYQFRNFLNNPEKVLHLRQLTSEEKNLICDKAFSAVIHALDRTIEKVISEILNNPTFEKQLASVSSKEQPKLPNPDECNEIFQVALIRALESRQEAPLNSLSKKLFADDNIAAGIEIMSSWDPEIAQKIEGNVFARSSLYMLKESFLAGSPLLVTSGDYIKYSLSVATMQIEHEIEALRVEKHKIEQELLNKDFDSKQLAELDKNKEEISIQLTEAIENKSIKIDERAYQLFWRKIYLTLFSKSNGPLDKQLEKTFSQLEAQIKALPQSKIEKSASVETSKEKLIDDCIKAFKAIKKIQEEK